MGFLRRDRRTLNEQLLDNYASTSEVRAVEAEEVEIFEPEPVDEAETETVTGPGGYWDVTVDAIDGELLEDSYEFATLADAVDSSLEAPYRAVAVRQGPEWWSISARRIDVVPLSLQGERARLVSTGGRFELEVDDRPVADATATTQLAAQAADLGEDYVVGATYLDGGLREITAVGTGR